MLKPYNFLYNLGDNSYSFTTVNDTLYYVYFSEGSAYFEQYPKISPLTYLFGFLTTSAKTLPDSRVKDTIITIILEYFSTNPNNIRLYVCDTDNQQGLHRSRKFNSWYKSLPYSGIIKKDEVICFDNCNYLSILFREDNIHAEEITDAFKCLSGDLFK